MDLNLSSFQLQKMHEFRKLQSAFRMHYFGCLTITNEVLCKAVHPQNEIAPYFLLIAESEVLFEGSESLAHLSPSDRKKLKMVYCIDAACDDEDEEDCFDIDAYLDLNVVVNPSRPDNYNT